MSPRRSRSLPTILATAILLCPFTLLAQAVVSTGSVGVAQTTPTTVKPPARGRIIGHVLCSDTHRPARGATIIVSPIPTGDAQLSMGFSTFGRVALDGSYTIDHVPPGEYGILALSPGYLSPAEDIPSSPASKPTPAQMRDLYGHTVTVHGQETETFDIALQRGASVSGRILYSDGAPAAQITIAFENINAKTIPTLEDAQNADPGTMIRGFFLRQSQTTDDLGRFRISGLKGGSYRIAAILPSTLSPFGSQDIGELIGYGSNDRSLRIYGGDTVHRKAATVYELRNGDETPGIDIILPLDLFHQVRGLLTAKDGRPINSASLTLTDTSDDTLTLFADVARSGDFPFGAVPPGTYKLTATRAVIYQPNPGMVEGIIFNEYNAKARRLT